MANRTFKSGLMQTSDPTPVTLYVAVAFNGSSAASLLKLDPLTGKYTVAPSAGTPFVTSFTRTGTGAFTLTLKDTYIRVLKAIPTFISNTNPVAPLFAVSVASDPNAAQAFGSAIGSGLVRTTGVVKFVFCSSANTPADPAATEMAIIEVVCQNSVGV